MKSFRQLAQQQYEHIRRQINNFDGTSMPAWEALPPVEKAAWAESVRQLIAEVQTIQ